jgi:hypothetical protein
MFSKDELSSVVGLKLPEVVDSPEVAPNVLLSVGSKMLFSVYFSCSNRSVWSVFVSKNAFDVDVSASGVYPPSVVASGSVVCTRVQIC